MFSLYRLPRFGRQCLYNAGTRERQWLPAVPNEMPWALLFEEGEKGRGYIHSAAVGTKWVSEFFDACIVEQGGELFYCTSAIERVPFAAWAQEHTPVNVALPLLHGGGDVQLDLFIFKRAWTGAYVWWSIAALVEHLHVPLGRLTTKRWMESWWPHWSKRLSNSGIGGAHLRRAIEPLRRTGCAARAASSLALESTGVRCLPAATWSTYALLSCLVRLLALQVLLHISNCCPHRPMVREVDALVVDSLSWALHDCNLRFGVPYIRCFLTFLDTYLYVAQVYSNREPLSHHWDLAMHARAVRRARLECECGRTAANR